HHRMRDLVLTLVSDADLEFDLPGWNPTLGGLLLEMGEVQGVYTHSFETLELDWNHRRLPPPDRLTVSDLRSWSPTTTKRWTTHSAASRKRNSTKSGSIEATDSSPHRSPSTRSIGKRSTSSTESSAPT